jgi:hypothetical protein
MFLVEEVETAWEEYPVTTWLRIMGRLMAPGKKAFPASSFICRGSAYSLREHVFSAFKGCFFLTDDFAAIYKIM